MCDVYYLSFITNLALWKVPYDSDEENLYLYSFLDPEIGDIIYAIGEYNTEYMNRCKKFLKFSSQRFRRFHLEDAFNLKPYNGPSQNRAVNIVNNNNKTKRSEASVKAGEAALRREAESATGGIARPINLPQRSSHLENGATVGISTPMVSSVGPNRSLAVFNGPSTSSGVGAGRSSYTSFRPHVARRPTAPRTRIASPNLLRPRPSSIRPQYERQRIGEGGSSPRPLRQMRVPRYVECEYSDDDFE